MMTQTTSTGESRCEIPQCDLGHAGQYTTLDEIAATIVNEIRQPLTAIMLHAEACLRWLMKDSPNFDEVRQATELIIENGRRAGDLIKSTRALEHRSSSEIAQLDINEVIAEMLGVMRADVLRHDVALTTKFAADLAPVIGNRVQLQQVMANLVANGVEAMSLVTDRSRVLRVSTGIAQGHHVLIAVADTGIGLDPITADRIFDPLFTTKSNGAGIGLSICRSIVEAHGGRLWATPQLPHGTVFQFVLPQPTDG